MHRLRLCGLAGQHREVVEGLCRTTPAGRQALGASQHLHQVAPQQVDVRRVIIPPLHQRHAQGRQVLQQHVPHPVQLPARPRLVAGQAGAQLLLHQIIRLIKAGSDLCIGGKARLSAGRPQRAEQVLPQAGQQDPLSPQLRKGHALPIPEGMSPGHQQTCRIRP